MGTQSELYYLFDLSLRACMPGEDFLPRTKKSSCFLDPWWRPRPRSMKVEESNEGSGVDALSSRGRSIWYTYGATRSSFDHKKICSPPRRAHALSVHHKTHQNHEYNYLLLWTPKSFASVIILCTPRPTPRARPAPQEPRRVVPRGDRGGDDASSASSPRRVRRSDPPCAWR